MANTMVLLAEKDSPKIYRVGKVGYDSGSSITMDPGNQPFTGTLKTERMSPAGEDGLARFRRVSLRALKTGDWSVTFTIWVDDVQTQRFDNEVTGSPLTDQTIVVSSSGTGSLGEDIIEADIDATGTFIQTRIQIDSDDITGVFLPESIEIHMQPIRQSKSRATAESQ